MNDRSNSLKPAASGLMAVHAVTLFANLMVSTSFPVGKEIAHAMEPGVLMLLRFVLAALIMGVFVYFRHGLVWPGTRALLRYALIALTVVIFFWCMFEALRYTSALNTSALFTTVPVLAAIFAFFLTGERLGSYRFAALALGLVGALWIIFRGDPERLLALDVNKGDVIFLAGCVAFGFYGVMIKSFHRGEPTAVMTFWILLCSAVFYVAIAAKDLAATKWLETDPIVYGGVAYLAVVSTVISFFLFQYATPRMGPTRVLAYTYFIPAFVLLVDWAIGRGLPPVMTLPGIAIVLIASFVIQRGVIDIGSPK
ncbi:MAG: DMT family transporter [Rhodospirillaceae bacterium]|nr:DMT family transporter [Rhodospirillaceae bacterium]MBT5779341.1 DMT family transporter [Rhodospirillaceae bacterium]MBT6829019.1 DMT family transporter [Rhodospirillaceae bacterium]MBT7290905.1 DMT family transporter [Rhodospirillaceae bacterium]